LSILKKILTRLKCQTWLSHGTLGSSLLAALRYCIRTQRSCIEISSLKMS
jgi:hypothetical protein